MESSLLPKIVHPKEQIACASRFKEKHPRDSVVPASCAVLFNAFASWASSSSDPTLTTSVCGPAITRRAKPKYCRSGHLHGRGDLLRVPLEWAEEGRGGLMKPGNRLLVVLVWMCPHSHFPSGFSHCLGQMGSRALELLSGTFCSLLITSLLSP